VLAFLRCKITKSSAIPLAAARAVLPIRGLHF
jgi:hypothetical protein